MPQTYFARRVTLAAALPTKYRLSDLIRAVDSTAPLGGSGEVFVEMPSTGAGNIVRGDSNLAALTDGKVFQPGDSERLSGGDTTQIYVGTDTPGATLFVEVYQG